MNEDKNTFKPADFSDAGNAAVFVREHCDDIIFTDSMAGSAGWQAVGTESSIKLWNWQRTFPSIC